MAVVVECRPICEAFVHIEAGATAFSLAAKPTYCGNVSEGYCRELVEHSEGRGGSTPAYEQLRVVEILLLACRKHWSDKL